MTDGIPQPRPAPDDQPEHGADRARRSADPWWSDVALRNVYALAATGLPFTNDDVRDRGVPDPHHHNQWGGVYATAAQAGVIECVGFRVARRRERAGGVLRVWRGTAAYREQVRAGMAGQGARPGGATG